MKRFLGRALAAGLLLAAQAASAASIGDIVRSSSSDPYLLNGGATRLVFPDSTTVETWGSPTSSTVATDVLPQWTLAGALPLREGSKLVKFGTDPQVYAVGPRGTLHWIVNEQVASALYGPEWNRRVVSLFSSYYPNYTLGASIAEAKLPTGTLFKYADSPTVYYLINGVMRPFVSETAFKANRFSFDSVLTVAPTFSYPKGTSIIGWELELNPIIQGS